MIDYLTPRFNLKSMASIDTCQSGATCNVSSAARTLSSPTEEPPNGKQSFSGPISPGRKRRERPVIMVIIHPAVSLLGKGLTRRWLVILVKDGLQQTKLLMLTDCTSQTKLREFKCGSPVLNVTLHHL